MMRYQAVGFVMLVLLSYGCRPKLTPDQEVLQEDNEYLLEVLGDWYWWRDEVELDIDPLAYNSPGELLEAVKYAERDRWSYVGDYAAYQQYYNAGSYAGYGVGLAWDADNKMRVRFVYDDSPFGLAGIERGWEVVQIDGVNVQDISDFGAALGPNEVGVGNTFLMENHEGERQEYSLSKTEVGINTVLHQEVIDVNGTKVAYLVFNTFVTTALEELDAAFAYFAAEGATELILDLRYNGGGRVSVAEHLGNYLAPSHAEGQVFAYQEHLAERADYDETYTFTKQGTLELSRITILQSQASASASELIINGLDPFMEVVLMGPSATRGKPVGSYAWENDPYVYSVIAFRMVNANGIAEYFDGFEPDLIAQDGLPYDWGDPQETMLAAALRYYDTGVIGRMGNPNLFPAQAIPFPNPLAEEIGAW